MIKFSRILSLLSWLAWMTLACLSAYLLVQLTNLRHNLELVNREVIPSQAMVSKLLEDHLKISFRKEQLAQVDLLSAFERREKITEIRNSLLQRRSSEILHIQALTAKFRALSRDSVLVGEKKLFSQIISALQDFSVNSEIFISDLLSTIDYAEMNGYVLRSQLEELRVKQALLDRAVSDMGSLIGEWSTMKAHFEHGQAQLLFTQMEIVLPSTIILLAGFLIAIAVLQKRNKQLQELSLVKGTSIALKHEINNPLSEIVTYSHVLKQQDLPVTQRNHMLDSIQQASFRVSKTLEKLDHIKVVNEAEYLTGEPMLDLGEDSAKLAKERT